ncbi:MAG: tRNA pseudouridine(38-40) synthase TruA [Dehalococcoidia bacterium]
MARDETAEPRRRLALMLEYDGTAYSGSQLQKNAPSVQGELEKALATLTGEAVRVKMAGRTDAGAHAKGQVASFLTAAPYTAEAFVRALNYYLPQDVAVKGVAEVAVEFDVRRQAASRLYRYTIYNGRQRSPLWAGYSWHVPASLDTAAMQAAARCLVGRHDFASFAPAMAGHTRRTMMRADVQRRGELVLLAMEADAFLPHQVRRTAGALAQVGLRRLTVAEFGRLVEEPRPGAAGPAAPPQGLCLIRVRYEGVKFGDGAEEDDADL